MPLVYTPKRLGLTAPGKYSTGINPGVTEIKECYLPSALKQGAKLANAGSEISQEPSAQSEGEAAEDGDANREELIFNAVKIIVDRGDEADFTVDSKPRCSAVEAITGFAVKSQECADALDAVMVASSS